MKVIFLDIDGVLNNGSTKEYAPSGFVGVSDELIKRLGRIVSGTGAKIVLSSDWKYEDSEMDIIDVKYLKKKLRDAANIEIFDSTPNIRSYKRGEEIKSYLNNRNDVTDFVIIDDIMFEDFEKYGLLENFVNTDPSDGLTEEKTEKAIKILNSHY